MWLPPTSNPPMRTPGAWATVPHRSVELGTPTSAWPVKSVPDFVVVMSTTGAAPDTVTDSLTDSICISTSMVSVVPWLTRISGRSIV